MADIPDRRDEVIRQLALNIEAVLQCASRFEIRIEAVIERPLGDPFRSLTPASAKT